MTYELHPLAEAIPLPLDFEYQELLTDIRINGLLDPITLYDGKVLDGRNRLRACREAGIEPRFTDFDGSNPAAYVISKNVKRRHLSFSEKAMAVAQVATVVKQLEEEAKARKQRNLKQGKQPPIPPRDGNGNGEVVDQEVEEPTDAPHRDQPQRNNKHANTTAARLGKLAGVSEKTMERAKYVCDHGTPEDVEEVKSGAKTVHRKAKEIRERHKNNTQTGTAKNAPEQKKQRAKTDDDLMAAEWKTCIRTLKDTLILEANNLPRGEARDRVARFQRALQTDVISTKAKRAMKTALQGLIGRCQEVLRQLG